ncbi:cytochrome p450 monooxygenase [Pyrenophora tritici-repentis]|nr:cytochrome p450 monooxygenase [Pyrenophora tritici-repentis]KAI0615227.1 cytochrome p450 monooxygenase [Pyrenophora tritici-repentis]KAI0627317.1 cytochrome p450 monooxygenase [Pyrenophora tritici-repentis]
MITALILSALTSFVVYHVVWRYRGLKYHLALAKSSGLPVVVLPWDTFSTFWLATFAIWLPILQRIVPKSQHGVWMDILHPEWSHLSGYSVFEKVGKDIFLVASPSKNWCFVANAEAIDQIATRRNDFPKPLEMYQSLNIYGKNLVTTEGSDWRTHRKLVAPSFSDKNYRLVFGETIHHAKSLLTLWAGPDGRGNKTVVDPSVAAMNLALYVISGAGFDVRVAWPHEDAKNQVDNKSGDDAIFVSTKPPPGHTMSYREALSILLHHMLWTVVFPLHWLPWSPVEIHRKVGVAVSEWGNYMDDIYQAKKKQVISGDNKEGMDIFNALIRGSGIADPKNTTVTTSDLFGNAFVLILAGHETTANALHFSLLLLAMKWHTQKKLQEDIDNVFGGKPMDQWNYEEHFPKLFSSMPAAILNETLRLLQPITNIPKSTAPGRPQQLTIDGQQYTIPGDTRILFNSAIHRNPKYWPPPADKPNKPGFNDADYFRPERWIVDAKPTEEFVDHEYDDEDLRGPSGEDTSSLLFKPVKGSYIPFSDGYRSCIGRRFAQVEMMVVLAAIFSQYSVEFAVEDWATDEEVEKMPKGGKERRELYQKAIDRAQYKLTHEMGSIITLQLRGSPVPIRLMKRGEERFAFD